MGGFPPEPTYEGPGDRPEPVAPPPPEPFPETTPWPDEVSPPDDREPSPPRDYPPTVPEPFPEVTTFPDEPYVEPKLPAEVLPPTELVVEVPLPAVGEFPTFPEGTEESQWVSVAPGWAETHPEEVIDVAGKYYRPAIRAGEDIERALKRAQLTGETVIVGAAPERGQLIIKDIRTGLTYTITEGVTKTYAKFVSRMLELEEAGIASPDPETEGYHIDIAGALSYGITEAELIELGITKEHIDYEVWRADLRDNFPELYNILMTEGHKALEAAVAELKVSYQEWQRKIESGEIIAIGAGEYMLAESTGTPGTEDYVPGYNDLPKEWQDYVMEQGATALGEKVESSLESMEPYSSIEHAALSGVPKVVEAAKFLYPEEYEGLEWTPELGIALEDIEATMRNPWLMRVDLNEIQKAARRLGLFETAFAKAREAHTGILAVQPYEWWDVLTEDEQKQVAAASMGTWPGLVTETFEATIFAGVTAPEFVTEKALGMLEGVNPKHFDIASKVIPMVISPVIGATLLFTSKETKEGWVESIGVGKDKVIESQQDFQEWTKDLHPAGRVPMSAVNFVYDVASSLGAVLPLTLFGGGIEATLGKEEMAKAAGDVTALGAGFLVWPFALPLMYAKDPYYGAGYSTGAVLTIVIGPKGLKDMATYVGRKFMPKGWRPSTITFTIDTGRIAEIVPAGTGPGRGIAYAEIILDWAQRTGGRNTMILCDAKGNVILKATPLAKAGGTYYFHVTNIGDIYKGQIAARGHVYDMSPQARLLPEGSPYPGTGIYASRSAYLDWFRGEYPGGTNPMVLGIEVTQPLRTIPPNVQVYLDKLNILDPRTTPSDVLADLCHKMRLEYERLELAGDLPQGFYPEWKAWWTEKLDSTGAPVLDEFNRPVLEFRIEPEIYISGNPPLYPTKVTWLTKIKEAEGLTGASYVWAPRDLPTAPLSDGTPGDIIKSGKKIPVLWLSDVPGSIPPTLIMKALAELYTIPADLKSVFQFPEKIDIGLGGYRGGVGIKPLELHHVPSIIDYLALKRRGTAVIRDPDLGILVTRTEGQTTFDLPGGTAFTQGESSIEVVLRETLDEAGLAPTGGKYLGHLKLKEQFMVDAGLANPYRIYEIYAVDAVGTPKPHAEIAEVAWWKPGSDIALSNNARTIINKLSYFEGRGSPFEIAEPQRCLDYESPRTYKLNEATGKVELMEKPEKVVALIEIDGKFLTIDGELPTAIRGYGNTSIDALRLKLNELGYDIDSYQYLQTLYDFPEGVWSKTQPGRLTDIYAVKVKAYEPVPGVELVSPEVLRPDYLATYEALKSVDKLNLQSMTRGVYENKFFTAVKIPQTAITEITKTQNTLRKRLGVLADNIDWIDPQNLHVTLKAPRSYTPEQMETAQKVLDALGRDFFTFDAKFKGVEGWPNPQNPQVLTLSAKIGGARWNELLKRVDAELTKAGFPPEALGVEPHITIGYLKGGVPTEVKMHISELIMSKQPTQVVKFKVDNITLKESLGAHQYATWKSDSYLEGGESTYPTKTTRFDLELDRPVDAGLQTTRAQWYDPIEEMKSLPEYYGIEEARVWELFPVPYPYLPRVEYAERARYPAKYVGVPEYPKVFPEVAALKYPPIEYPPIEYPPIEYVKEYPPEEVPPTEEVPPVEYPPPPPPPVIIPPEKILPPPPPGVPKRLEERVRIPPGSIAWKQGALKRKGELVPVWRYIPPPFTQRKPLTLVGEPIGAVRTGMKTPRETLQVVGRAPEVIVPRDVHIDLGIADVYVTEGGKSIRFAGKGLKTDIGAGVVGPEKGMSTYGRKKVKPEAPGPIGPEGERIMPEENPLGVAGLKLGTTLHQLLTEPPPSEAQREFREKEISRCLSEIAPEEIAQEIKDAGLTEPKYEGKGKKRVDVNAQRIDELLLHLPDRVRANVRRLLEEKLYIPLPGAHYAEAEPSWRRMKALEAEALGEEEVKKRKRKGKRLLGEQEPPTSVIRIL